MKTQSLEKSLNPAFVIRVHLTDGSVESFAQTDATEAQKLWDKIEPSRLFAQSRLVVAGEHSKSVFVTAHILRVDFIQDTNECWQFPGGYSDVVELSEEDFRKNAHLDEPELMAAREQPTPVGDLLVSFLKLHITGAKPLYLMIEFPVKLPAENQSFMQFMLSKSGLHMRLCGGGIGVINLAHLAGYNVYPGVAQVPADSWIAEPFSKRTITQELTHTIMAKPVIWTVDDDPDVLRAVERDLRRQYGDRYKVISADSGASALEAVKQLKLRNETVALFLVDQRMPRMSGVEFLEKAIEFYPDAKRALLTAYADTDAAIRAINSVQIDHYLMKPWDPPEERLFGVVDDLLDDWQASYHPVFEGVRVIGHRWSPQSNEIRDFLGRNFVPHQWLNIETDESAKQLLATTGAAASSLPIVVFPDGSFVGNPPTAEVARKLGLKTKAESPFYDLVVVGAGPAGLAAAVYGAADGLHTLLIEREAPGGQAGRSSRIENYLGFPMGLSGSDLARRAVAQARRFGVEILAPQEVTGIRIEGPSRVLTLTDGSEIGCRALLIATGIAFRKLNVPGLDKLNGAGVYYYAPMSEAFSYRDGDIYIVGGANSAGQAAMYFSKFARQVTMLVRGDSLSDTMSQYLENQIAATKNIAVRINSSVIAVEGVDRCETITIQNNKTRSQETVSASALLIYAGAIPRTDWLTGIVERDAQGYLITGQHLMREGRRAKGWTADRDPLYLESSVPGIFVAGDVRHRSAKGVTSGVGEGAMAVKLVHEYLGLL